MKTDTVFSSSVKLPKLSANLMTLYNDGKILESSNSFIYFWGTHLLEITNNEPTKNDTDNYAQAIVAAYPVLAGGKTPHVSMQYFNNYKFFCTLSVSQAQLFSSG